MTSLFKNLVAFFSLLLIFSLLLADIEEIHARRGNSSRSHRGNRHFSHSSRNINVTCVEQLLKARLLASPKDAQLVRLERKLKKLQKRGKEKSRSLARAFRECVLVSSAKSGKVNGKKVKNA